MHTRRCQSILLLLVSAILLSACSPEPEKKTRPNILLIMADDLGWGDVGYNGQQKIKTPNIDRLAAEGMIFDRMYAGSTVCGPSRAALLTGLHSGHGEVRGNPRWSLSGTPVDFDPAHETIAENLKKAGYRTGMVGKWGLAENLGGTRPNEQGFDYFYGFNKHLPAHHYYPEAIWENDSLLRLPQNHTAQKQGDHVQELFTQKALDFLDQKTNDPFFLYLAYTTPHFELTIPEEYKTEYRAQDWPLREMKEGHYYHDKNGHVTYAAMVSKMDADIGRLIDQLKQSGQYENTLIIFTSDNGHEYDRVNPEFFDSNGPYRGRKRDLYDGGIHMPFLASWPSVIEPGQRTNYLAAFWDIKATLAEVAGAKPEKEGDGISFLPTILGKPEQAQHELLYWEFNERKGPIQAIVSDHWKLIRYVENDRYELFDLEKDPGELNNVHSENPDWFEKLKGQLLAERTESSQFPLTRRPDPWRN